MQFDSNISLEQPSANKVENLLVGIFMDTYGLAQFNNEDPEHLDRFMMSNEFETVQTVKPGAEALRAKFSRIFEELTQTLSNHLNTLKERESLTNCVGKINFHMQRLRESSVCVASQKVNPGQMVQDPGFGNDLVCKTPKHR